MREVERPFEAALWATRYVVMVAVVGSLAASLATFYVAAVDTVLTVYHALPYPRLDDAARAALKVTTLKHLVAVVDGYLLGAVLLIFAFGLYEIFISRIDLAERAETRAGVLVIRTLDDLKGRLAKVILLILVVSFFERVLTMPLGTPLDLLMAAAAIALVSGALWLGHGAPGKEH